MICETRRELSTSMALLCQGLGNGDTLVSFVFAQMSHWFPFVTLWSSYDHDERDRAHTARSTEYFAIVSRGNYMFQQKPLDYTYQDHEVESLSSFS
jgi:hypothetical protein